LDSFQAKALSQGGDCFEIPTGAQLASEFEAAHFAPDAEETVFEAGAASLCLEAQPGHVPVAVEALEGLFKNGKCGFWFWIPRLFDAVALLTHPFGVRVRLFLSLMEPAVGCSEIHLGVFQGCFERIEGAALAMFLGIVEELAALRIKVDRERAKTAHRVAGLKFCRIFV